MSLPEMRVAGRVGRPGRSPLGTACSVKKARSAESIACINKQTCDARQPREMDPSVTGLFELCQASGTGLVDARLDDLLVMTTSQSQQILIGCGRDAISSMRVAADHITFNTPLSMTSLSLCNLDIGTSLSVPAIQCTAPSGLMVQSFAGPIAFSATSGVAFTSSFGNMTFKVGVSERMRVGANGFVGIGTAVPRARSTSTGASASGACRCCRGRWALRPGPSWTTC